MSGSSTRNYGQEIAKLRRARGLTQTDLAREAGIIRQVVVAVETGRTVPTLTTLERIARALRTPAWRIVRGAEKDGA